MHKPLRRALLLAFVLAAPAAFAGSEDFGVVLLHGKGGSPAGHIQQLAFALQGKGYRVSTPAMPWARERIYDATFEQAMAEIEREVDALRGKGAKVVVVAGHSIGANAALGYAASRQAGGIIALAPAHSPELPGFGERVGADVSRAKALVAAGKGKERERFSDVNQGQASQVAAAAEVYLSWFAPDGPAVMPRSAASFKAPTPLLFIVGTGERNAPAKDTIFDKAPPHPKSRFASVNAGHLGVPSAAIAEVLAWLETLAP